LKNTLLDVNEVKR